MARSDHRRRRGDERKPVFRRRYIVDGFQMRFIITHLLSLALLLGAMVAVAVGPSVIAMYGPADAAQREAADRLLVLHRVIWPLVIAFFLGAAAVSVKMTHRVAGPLFRFRQVFRQMRRGVLTTRVRTRERDYLQLEAEELDQALGSLRSRVAGIRAALDRAHALSGTGPAGSGDGRTAWDPALAEAIDDAWSRCREFEVDAAPGRHDAAKEAAVAVPPQGAGQAGFTLVELLLVAGTVAVLASIAMPAYSTALEVARVTRAIGDITALDREIRLYQMSHGCFPSTLADVGRATLTDPWGRAYVYGALSRPGGGGGGGGRGRSGGGGGGGCSACAGGCLTPGQARKDRRLVPINADFDLYSLGKDGLSAAALTAGVSQDDVVRGSDGGFVGLGRSY